MSTDQQFNISQSASEILTTVSLRHSATVSYTGLHVLGNAIRGAQSPVAMHNSQWRRNLRYEGAFTHPK